MNIDFKKTENPIITSDIQEFEIKNKISLPDEYKDLLLSYNGGIPKRNVYLGGASLGQLIHRFYSLKYGNMRLEEAIDDLQITEQVIPKDLLPIAYDPSGNTYCISLAKKDYGKIYIWLHDVGGEKAFVADSLIEFLENTITYEEWQQRQG